jgi:monomeric sarcosine oxidase
MPTDPTFESEPRNLAVPPPSGSSFDIIIIGGGTIGLSAAYYAAARGLKTLLLEQFDSLANPWAGSGGTSRMFRIMYSPAFMAQLAEVSLALWKEIETASGLEILWTQPLIFYGDPEQTVEGDLGQMHQILAKLGVPDTWYPNSAGLMQQYPAFKNMPPNYVGLVQANSAVIRTKTSISAFATLAAKAGATLLTKQPATVTAIPTEGPYKVTCPAGTYSAPQLVLCPGPWTNSVLKPFGIQLNLTIWQMTVGYFQADVGTYAYPLWYEFGPDERSLFYGFPPAEVPGALKASADFTNNIYTDPTKCTHQPDPRILSQVGTFLQQRFNGVQPTASQTSTCLYTMSSDAQVILDRVSHNVAIFTGDSGRGFKFTPLFGRILVDLATSGRTYYDITPFSIKRPGVIKR